jgi:hypothetical protein
VQGLTFVYISSYIETHLRAMAVALRDPQEWLRYENAQSLIRSLQEFGPHSRNRKIFFSGKQCIVQKKG